MPHEVSHAPGRRAIFTASIAVSLIAALAIGCGNGNDQSTPTPADRDWPMFGHDLRHSFAAGRASVDKTNAPSLKLTWKVAMPDAVSAPPSVVAGAVYIGAWDGVMYALDAASGAVRWTFEVDCQNGILPIPPRCLAPGQAEPDRTGTDGGLIVGAAAVTDGKVYFGGVRSSGSASSAGTLMMRAASWTRTTPRSFSRRRWSRTAW
jgi:PQQ enzyme repeat